MRDRLPGHAYSILGWDYVNGTKFIILRNPWGCHEPTVGIETGNIRMYDISWWRNIDLVGLDGAFGIEVTIYKQYFNYIGGGRAQEY